MNKIQERFGSSRRAFIAPFIVIMVMLFLSVMTIVIDGGRMIVAHSELQGLSQVAALCGSTGLSFSESAARSNVKMFLERNNMTDCDCSIAIKGNTVSVVITRVVPLLFSGVVNRRAVKVSATSRAALNGGQVRLVP